jgi:hypothetical protein
MRSVLVILAAIATAPALHGCAKPQGNESPAIRTSAEDAPNTVTLTTETRAGEIGIAERLWVIDTVSWASIGQPVFEPREWDVTEWTVIDTIEAPARLVDDRYLRERRTQIEPFLPGTYEIPAAVIRYETPDAREPVLLTADAIAVEVQGVLPDEDEGELNAIADASIPSDPDANDARLIWGGVILVLVIISGGVLYVLRTSTPRASNRTLFQELNAISQSKDPDPRAGYERLSRVLERIDPRLRSTSEFAEMIRVCDQARFSAAPDIRVHTAPQRLAAHALELLGHDAPRTEERVPA